MTTTIAYVWADDPSPKLRAGFRDAAAIWESVLDVDFLETTGAADLTIYVSDIYGPGAADIGGPGLWLDPSLEERWGAWEPGSYSFFVLAHELGHHLGLDHRYDLTMHESAMSATYVYAPDSTVLPPETPMPADIAALVPVYGANDATAGHRTWHRVTDSAGLSTVHDAGGRGDVLDLSAILAPATVDLGSGLVTYSDGYLHTMGIEGVRLGPGADMVVLHAGDVVYGLGKSDVLITLDGEADRLTRNEKRAAGVAGRWWDVDGAMIEWRGGEKALERLVVEGKDD